MSTSGGVPSNAGASSWNVTSQGNGYVANSNDLVISTGAGGPVDMSLPVAPSIGSRVAFFFPADQTPTISASAGQQIEGPTPFGGPSPTFVSSLETSPNYGLPYYIEFTYVGTVGGTPTWIVTRVQGSDWGYGASFFGTVALNDGFYLNAQGSTIHSGSYQILITDTLVRKLTNAAATWTLPTPNTALGQVLILMNQNTGIITLTGSSQIASVPPESTVMLWSDGSEWRMGGPTLATASNTAQGAKVTTTVPTTAVAFIPNAIQDAEIFFVVTTADLLTITYGPTTGAENTLVSAVTMPIGASFTKRIPANWSVIITGTIANLSAVTIQTC